MTTTLVAAGIAAVCVLLWLSGRVRVWIPTLLLWLFVPLLLWGRSAVFAPWEVLRWSADPILAVFLCGFVLEGMARAHGLDHVILRAIDRVAGAHGMRLLALAAGGTALLSMWMSNVAAATLMFAAFAPRVTDEATPQPLRQAILLAIALGGNLGGIASPVGTGSNAIAIAALDGVRPITFVMWMGFGVPLAAGLLAAVLLWMRRHYADVLQVRLPARLQHPEGGRITGRARATIALGLVTLLLWLTEPLHGIPAWTVAVGTSVVALLTRLLPWDQVRTLDWGTLLLIAGGMAVGRLLEHGGVLALVPTLLPADASPRLLLVLLALLSASLASVMSNTGTTAVLVPMALQLLPTPSTAVVVAIAASFGMPFLISTPPNAMAVARGLPGRVLLRPGLVLLVAGSVLVALTGPWVLARLGL